MALKRGALLAGLGLRAGSLRLIGLRLAVLARCFAPAYFDMSLKFLKLTPMEIQVANQIKQGKLSKEIAEVLSVSKHTVDTHRRNIRKKMRIYNKKKNLRGSLISLQ